MAQLLSKSKHRTLIRGVKAILPGTKEGQSAYQIETSDILIVHGVIEDIRPLASGSRIGEEPGDEIIQGRDRILLPGLIDSHRHLWQSLLRTLPSEMTLFQFLADLNVAAASFYTPEDVYIAEIVGALECLNAGITSVLDHFHLSNSVEHIVAGLDALNDSGLSGVFAIGTNKLAHFPKRDKSNATGASTKVMEFHDASWQLNFLQTIKKHIRPSTVDESKDTQLYHGSIKIGLALDRWKAMSEKELEQLLAVAYTNGISPITLHVSNGAFSAPSDEPVLKLEKHITSDWVLSHANFLTTAELDVIASKDAKLSATPEIELHLNMGRSIVRQGDKHGCCVGLGTDTTALVDGNLFNVMRFCLAQERFEVNQQYRQSGKFPQHLYPSSESVLKRATELNAQVLGLEDRVGRISKGMQANLILLRSDTPNMLGSDFKGSNTVSATVLHASIHDVDTVLVGGNILKRDGRIVLATAAMTRLQQIATQRGILKNGAADDYELVKLLASNSAERLRRQLSNVDLEAIKTQMSKFVGLGDKLA